MQRCNYVWDMNNGKGWMRCEMMSHEHIPESIHRHGYSWVNTKAEELYPHYWLLYEFEGF